MSKMDKKQRKEKKREEKAKRIKMKHIDESSGITENEKKFGKVQLYIFLCIAVAGALFIILNV